MDDGSELGRHGKYIRGARAVLLLAIKAAREAACLQRQWTGTSQEEPGYMGIDL
jgi:hypothetical protein